MKISFCLRLFLAAAFVTISSGVSYAQSLPLVSAQESIFSDQGNASYDSVRNAALAQSTSAPFYKSNSVQTRIYEGYFKPRSNNTKIALLSDDGTSVWINGQKVLSRAGQPQGFEAFDSTFVPLSQSFVAGQIYNLKLEYTNTIHQGAADVDGISLWAYDGGGDIVEPTISLSLSATEICAGGWDDSRSAFEYLVKETGQWKARSDKPDPHIATATALVKDDQGNPMEGVPVTLSWDMPGPAPAQTKTVISNADGTVAVDVISGDEVSKDTDEDTGHLLFNRPVPIKATCASIQVTKNIDVTAPVTTWQYKNEEGDYVVWDGEVYGLYPNTVHRKDIPLRVLWTFNNQPVTGHRMSWSIDKIFDKFEEEVLPTDEDYVTYGTLSGPISTTGSNGGATATFTHGYNFGQIVFGIADNNIYTSD